MAKLKFEPFEIAEEDEWAARKTPIRIEQRSADRGTVVARGDWQTRAETPGPWSGTRKV